MTAAMPADQRELQGLGDHWAAALVALHARIAPRFQCAEVCARARRYLEGLLGQV